MFGLQRLWAAIARLADTVNALADTAAEVNGGVRARLGLDTPERAQLPGGEVIEEPESEPANGRRKRK